VCVYIYLPAVFPGVHTDTRSYLIRRSRGVKYHFSLAAATALLPPAMPTAAVATTTTTAAAVATVTTTANLVDRFYVALFSSL